MQYVLSTSKIQSAIKEAETQNDWPLVELYLMVQQKRAELLSAIQRTEKYNCGEFWINCED